MFNIYVLNLLLFTITLMFTCGLINQLFPVVEYVIPVAILFQQVHMLLRQTLTILTAHVQVFALNTRDNFLQAIHVMKAKISI